MNTLPPSREELEKQLEIVFSSITHAHAEASDGAVKDITHIQTEVDSFCKNLSLLPVLSQVEFKDKIGEVLEKLDKLAELLNNKKALLEKQLGQTTNSKNAAKAYLRAKKDI